MDRTTTPSRVLVDRVAEFEREWIGAWNAHDLDRIMSHYCDDVRFVSPFAARFGARHGEVRGRPALRDYFERGLASYPELRFETIAALGGIGSIALHYWSVEDRQAIELMELDSLGQVRQAFVHYGAPSSARAITAHSPSSRPPDKHTNRGRKDST